MGKEEKTRLGEQELELLRFVTDRAAVTARDAVAEFGQSKGLARTTVLTMLERLRKKGFLLREDENPPAKYRPAQAKSEVIQGMIADFVERTLGGSPVPFVAYLVQSKSIKAEEAEQLRALLNELEREDAD